MVLTTSSCIKTSMSCFHYRKKSLLNNRTIQHKWTCSSSKRMLRKKAWIRFSSLISKNTTFYFFFFAFLRAFVVAGALWRTTEKCGTCRSSWQSAATWAGLSVAFWDFHQVLFQFCRNQEVIKINSQEMIPSNIKGNKSWMHPKSFLHARTQEDT